MIHNPICPFKTIFYIFEGPTEITVIRLNDGKRIYKGTIQESLKDLEVDHMNLVVAYSGIYNNRNTGTIDIEVWDLSELEDL